MVPPGFHPIEGGTETIVRDLSIGLNNVGVHVDIMAFNMNQKRPDTGNCMKMVEGIIKCAEVSGAKFITAYELARLSMAEFLNNNFDYDNQPNP
jgi:hypothetical protein